MVPCTAAPESVIALRHPEGRAPSFLLEFLSDWFSNFAARMLSVRYL